jgi:NAD(P)H-quinone oxidoreductase subunit 5
MPASSTLLPYAAPLALMAAAVIARLQPGLRPTRALSASRVASIVAFITTPVSLVALIHFGPATSALIGAGGLGFAVRLDALSLTMAMLVSFVGLIVIQFSRNYLDGDARQGLFLSRLCATLAAVLLIVTAGNLVQLIVAWTATSLMLHKLLLFYPERPLARMAARKKFIVARLGDAFLLTAATILVAIFGTGDIAVMSEQMRALAGGATVPSGLWVAALCIAAAALLKSAQFPAHGWLTEVIETPTPVSALLHAGIINAGGFLLIRFSDLIVLSPISMHVLVLVGGFTALFGGLAMLTQPSVKVSLAWSTISQMGFMIMQCGFGAFALATAHIVAHSLYKAHAFLASGSAVDIARLTRAKPAAMPRAKHLAFALAITATLYAALAFATAQWIAKPPAILALGAILVTGLALYVTRGLQADRPVRLFAQVFVTTVLATAIYFVVSAASSAWLGGVAAPIPTPGPVALALMGLAVVSFLSVVALQLAMRANILPPAWRAHLSNGLYANALFNRLVHAYRVKPAGQGM